MLTPPQPSFASIPAQVMQGAALSVGGMGELKAVTAGAGKHGYAVEHPPGHDKYVPIAYFLKVDAAAAAKASAAGGPTPKITSGNFFAGMNCDCGSGLTIGWKCSFKTCTRRSVPINHLS